MFTTRFQVTAGALAGALLMTGVTEVGVPAQAADGPEVVRFGWFGGPRPWVIGKADGMFEQALGTEVEWVQFPSGAAALNSIRPRRSTSAGSARPRRSPASHVVCPWR